MTKVLSDTCNNQQELNVFIRQNCLHYSTIQTTSTPKCTINLFTKTVNTSKWNEHFLLCNFEIDLGYDYHVTCHVAHNTK